MAPRKVARRAGKTERAAKGQQTSPLPERCFLVGFTAGAEHKPDPETICVKLDGPDRGVGQWTPAFKYQMSRYTTIMKGNEAAAWHIPKAAFVTYWKPDPGCRVFFSLKAEKFILDAPKSKDRERRSSQKLRPATLAPR